MRIESIQYEELDSGWKLLETKFASDVTLLVGLSGAGKTRILSAIRNLCSLATSNSIELSTPIQFELVFKTADGAEFTWTGRTKKIAENFVFSEESLSVAGVYIFKKDSESLEFRDQQLPALSGSMSGLRLFKDSEISEVLQGFENTVLVNHGTPPEWHVEVQSKKEFDAIISKCPTIVELRKSDLSLQSRVFLASHVAKDEFNEINSRFVSIFPSIDKLELFSPSVDDYQVFVPMVFEKGLKRPYQFSNLSAGMLNALRLIAYCYLWPQDTLVLIDEFESSMGVNCLDDATDLVLETSQRMQFILTSHHPYVINNIRPENWKIVSRNGSEVSTHDAGAIGIGSSHHTAFTQLMNSPEYAKGILSE